MKNKEVNLEEYFQEYRENVVGQNQYFESPYGTKKIIYADWTASGRLYTEVEDKIKNVFGPFVGNTHTETSVTGTAMTLAYHEARDIIKKHVNCGVNDVLITTENGMTGAVNKFQRILGLKVGENVKKYTNLPEDIKPVVFITHMEHHSNHTSWLETIAKVEVIKATDSGLVDLNHLEELLKKYSDKTIKMASVTACSNVTGIQPPIHEIAEIMHKHGGLCFADYACSAPYVDIDMHPDNNGYLDAVMFSPHKFLGGPGTSGVLIFNKNLYKNTIPDAPGGGTVSWTNPWGEHMYLEDIEEREDGGTPGFLQVIRTALSINLKNKMGTGNIQKREHELLDIVFEKLDNVNNLIILANNNKDRLGVISFYIKDMHYNFGVKILNDKFGIQVRGGCSCAGTYGHYLLSVSKEQSNDITCEISHGDLSQKPGWIRMSIHPVMTNAEVEFICDSIIDVADNHKSYVSEYEFNANNNEFSYKNYVKTENDMVKSWFE
ncbi:MAG: aminotransferase class V-fold PLP-dependent enzyme [Ichthyobacteriaceae bacterium]|nr:aminotransferase class V-fold PLP-dependent enzyme [Ichthyobacteriaceae bacterium]